MRYFDEIIALLNEIQETQHEAMERAAQVIANAIAADHLVYVFGATHAGILAQELFYRAGGLVPVNPVLLPGLVTDVRPATLISRLERMAGLGTEIAAESPIEADDVLIVHSVFGSQCDRGRIRPGRAAARCLRHRADIGWLLISRSAAPARNAAPL